MKLLHIDSSILGDNSASRAVTAAAAARMQSLHPGLEVKYRDLAAHPVGPLTGAYLAGQSPDVAHDQAMQEDLSLGGEVLAEFLAADIVVLGAPMYNLGIPAQLKAWVDRILVAGKTFHYTENGPVGLAGGKRVVLALARGGFYGPGTPAAHVEHSESYLRAVLGFIGLPDIEAIVAEGIATGPEQRQKALDGALAQANALAA